MTREELVLYAQTMQAKYSDSQRHVSVLVRRREQASEATRMGALLQRGNVNVSKTCSS
jgi:hypothetical protein